MLRSSQVMDFLKTFPVAKIRGLGGKLGTILYFTFRKCRGIYLQSKFEESDLQINVARDVWNYSLEKLQSVLGEETGQWLHDISV